LFTAAIEGEISDFDNDDAANEKEMESNREDSDAFVGKGECIVLFVTCPLIRTFLDSKKLKYNGRVRQ
jgi:hypothetical protein